MQDDEKWTEFYAVYVLNGVRIPARDVDRGNARKQLHGAIKEALALMQNHDQCTVYVYDQARPGVFLRLLYTEVAFFRNGDHGVFVTDHSEDWLLPYLTPEAPRV